MDQTAMENALHAWVSAALAFDVIWADQNAPAPAIPARGGRYGTIRLTGPFGQGAELASATNLSNPAGQEIEQTVSEQQEWSLSVQVYGANARAQLAGAKLKLQLPAALEALRAAGVAVVDVGDTQDVSALVGSQIETRALMDVRIRTVDSATERTGYIDRVGISSPFTGKFDAP
jgi:hypothetical protein